MVKKSRIYRRRRILFSSLIIIIALLITMLALSLNTNHDNDINALEESTSVSTSDISEIPAALPITEIKLQYPEYNIATKTITSVDSDYAILIDIENNKVLADKNGTQRISPASLTKLMTLVVAVENIDDFEDTFTMTGDIIAPLVDKDASRAGFSEGDQVKITDMLYGAVLPSGADATVGLAQYISGSEEEFVKLMNQKVNELGLKNTHFTNTSGLYDDNHYSTVTDIALILEYAIKNDLCRKILSTYQYTTSPTPQHPEGILLTSTMFSRMYGNEVENVKILGGKTGYIYESLHCLASFAEKNGNEYIAVTVMGHGKYKPIYDAFELYGKYLN